MFASIDSAFIDPIRFSEKVTLRDRVVLCIEQLSIYQYRASIYDEGGKPPQNNYSEPVLVTVSREETVALMDAACYQDARKTGKQTWLVLKSCKCPKSPPPTNSWRQRLLDTMQAWLKVKDPEPARFGVALLVVGTKEEACIVNSVVTLILRENGRWMGQNGADLPAVRIYILPNRW